MGDERCWYGNGCYNDNCNRVHPCDQTRKYKFVALRENAKRRKDCYDGFYCSDLDCEYTHPHQDEGVDGYFSESDDDESNWGTEYSDDTFDEDEDEKCRYNKKCTKKNCQYWHDTRSGKSPAFEKKPENKFEAQFGIQKLLKLQLENTQKDIQKLQQQIELQKYFALRQNQNREEEKVQQVPNRLPLSFQQPQPVIVKQEVINKYEYKVTDKIKSNLKNTENSLKKLQIDHQYIFLGFNIDVENDKISIMLNQSYEGWEKIQEKILKQLNQNCSKVVLFPNTPHYPLQHIMSHHQQLQSLQDILNVKIQVNQARVKIEGNIEDNVDLARDQIGVLVSQANEQLEIRQITDENKLQNYLRIKQGAKIFQKRYNIRIIDQEEQEEQKVISKDMIGFNRPSSKKKLKFGLKQLNRKYIWTYQITDKEPIALDEQSNTMIEDVYKLCCERNDFSMKLPITLKLEGDELKYYKIEGKGPGNDQWSLVDQQTFQSIQLLRKLEKEEQKDQVAKNEPQNCDQETTRDSEKQQQKTLEIQGQKEMLDNFEQFLEQYQENVDNNNQMPIQQLDCEVIELDQKNLEHMNNADHIIQVLNSMYQVELQLNHNKLLIKGDRAQEAKSKIQQLFNDIKKYQLPENWENVLELVMQMDNLMIVDLSPLSEDYIKASTSFQMTMPDTVILSIQRIQNRQQWKFYSFEKNDRIPDLNGKESEELLLFYGSQNINPLDICKSKNSIIGNQYQSPMVYLNEFSYKCQDNCYKTNDGNQQILLVRALVGNYIEIPYDTMIDEAPVMDDLTGQRYDSVKLVNEQDCTFGFTVFGNNRVYPEFLITFK